MKIKPILHKNLTKEAVKFDLNCRKIFGFSLFGRGKGELLKVIQSELEKSSKIWIATVNPEFVMQTINSKDFLNILASKTTFNVPDGVGLIWALKTVNSNWKLVNGIKTGLEILRGKHKEALITGADLIDDLCQLAVKNNRSVYFYGGWKNRSEKTALYFLKKYPTLKVAGYSEEKFDFNLKIDFLFVARGMKKQEEWINDNFDKLKIKLVMGVGRSFDYYSGELKRAPEWMRKMGLEWFFSLIMEPKRWRRQLQLPKFVWKVLNS